MCPSVIPCSMSIHAVGRASPSTREISRRRTRSSRHNPSLFPARGNEVSKRGPMLLSHRTLIAKLFTIVLLLEVATWSQSFRGSIRGRVIDPSGSVISGATVNAKNIATGIERQVATGDDGQYVLAELPAGTYTVTAQAPGLSPAAQNVVVNIGLDTTADFDLTKVERRQERVTVTEEAPLVEATRDVLGEVVNRKLVSDLPVNGR